MKTEENKKKGDNHSLGGMGKRSLPVGILGSSFVVVLLVLTACTRSEPDTGDAASDRPPTVYTVNYPLAYFAGRIGGDHVNIVFPAPADVDPAFWSPGDETIAGYQDADLVLLNGADYARWTTRVSLPPSRLVDTSKPFADRLIEIDEDVTHTHGPGGAHTHGALAFTTWLDPELAAGHARVITDAFSSRWPDHAADFDRGFETLRQELDTLAGELDQLAPRLSAQPLLFSHPVYQYLERYLELDARSLHWEPDVIPTVQQWAALDELLKTHRARWMIWEGPPADAIVAELESRGVRVAVFAPCGNRPREGDFLTVMRGNAENLRHLVP